MDPMIGLYSHLWLNSCLCEMIFLFRQVHVSRSYLNMTDCWQCFRTFYIARSKHVLVCLSTSLLDRLHNGFFFFFFLSHMDVQAEGLKCFVAVNMCDSQFALHHRTAQTQTTCHHTRTGIYFIFFMEVNILFSSFRFHTDLQTAFYSVAKMLLLNWVCFPLCPL